MALTFTKTLPSLTSITRTRTQLLLWILGGVDENWLEYAGAILDTTTAILNATATLCSALRFVNVYVIFAGARAGASSGVAVRKLRLCP
jgi:hypothetical protein